MEPSLTGGSEYERALCAHAQHYAGILAAQSPALFGSGRADQGSGQQQALALLSAEHENLLAALDTALATDRLDMLQSFARHLRPYLDITSAFVALRECYQQLLAAALRLKWRELELPARYGLAQACHRCGNFEECLLHCQAALALAAAQGERDAEANCLLSFGNVELMQDNYAAARELYLAALDIWQGLGDDPGRASSLNALGNLEYLQDNLDAAWDMNHRALLLSRTSGNRYREGNTLNSLGKVEFGRGRLRSAQRFFEQALQIRRELQDLHGMAGSLNNLGSLERLKGNAGAAAELLESAADLARELGDPYGESNALSNAGAVALQRGDYPAAARFFVRALEILTRNSDRTGMIVTCVSAAALLGAADSYAGAARILSGALRQAADIGYEFEADDRPTVEIALAQLAAAADSGGVDAEQLEKWRGEGETLSLEELVELTLGALRADMS